MRTLWVLIRTLGRCSGRRNNQLVKKLRPAEYCTLLHFHLYLLMPGFHFPHSHFPGIALPKKMSSKIEKAYALLQALFSWEPPRVRVRTGFPEKLVFKLTSDAGRLRPETWRLRGGSRRIPGRGNRLTKGPSHRLCFTPSDSHTKGLGPSLCIWLCKLLWGRHLDMNDNNNCVNTSRQVLVSLLQYIKASWQPQRDPPCLAHWQ